MAAKDPIVVMVKPVGSRCNMRCAYCYYLEKGKYSSHETQSVMSLDLLETMIRKTVEACEGSTVSFVWHGGEPTLAGIPFFRKALQLERRYLREGQEAWNNLQTNGVLIDDEWAAFLSRHHFDVGVSIDGSEAVHDKNRRLLGGQSGYEKTVKGIRALQKAGLQPDLLCTVNAESCKDPLSVYRALRDLKTGWIQFIPIIVREGDGVTEESITAEEYGRFLSVIFDEWITNDLGRTDVQLFAEMAHIMAGSEASLCWMARTCGRVLIAEEDGALYACDHFVDDEHRIGRVDETEKLRDVADGDFMESFGQKKRDSLTRECQECPYLTFCNGACLKDRFGTSVYGEEGQYYLCDGLKAFFAHAVEPMQKAMTLIRSGEDPETVMKRMRKQLRK